MPQVQGDCQMQTAPPDGSCLPGWSVNPSTLGPYKNQDQVFNTLSGGFYTYSWESAPLRGAFFQDFSEGTCNDLRYDWNAPDPGGAVWLAMSASSASLMCNPPPDGLSPSGISMCGPLGPQLNPYFCSDTQNCVFIAYGQQCAAEGSTHVGGDRLVKCPQVAYEQMACMQTLWPPQDDPSTKENRWNCCLGTGWAADPVEALKYCAPAWNPLDPQGECEDAIVAYCREHSVSVNEDPNNPVGPWVHGFLNSDSVCGAWYGAALVNEIVNPQTSADMFIPLPKTRWPTLDLEIASYCDIYGDVDTLSCACVNYGFGGNQLCHNPSDGSAPTQTTETAGCQAYASDSSHGDVATAVNVVTAGPGGGFPVGVTDYVCTAPQCSIITSQDLPTPSLVPFDAWFPQFKHTCPSLCLQFITGNVVTVGDVDSGGYVYLGDMNASCTDANGSTPSAAPAVQMDATQTQIVFVNQNTADCGLGICESQVLLAFLNPTPNELEYTITCNDMPSWMQFENPGDALGVAASDITKQINLFIPITGDVPVGVHDVHCVVADRTGNFPSAKAATTMRVQAIPMQPPQGPQPLLPNPGAGVPVVWKDQSPPWLPYIVVAMCLLLLLALFHWTSGRKAKTNIVEVERDLRVLHNPKSTREMRAFAKQDLKN